MVMHSCVQFHTANIIQYIIVQLTTIPEYAVFCIPTITIHITRIMYILNNNNNNNNRNNNQRRSQELHLGGINFN